MDWKFEWIILNDMNPINFSSILVIGSVTNLHLFVYHL